MKTNFIASLFLIAVLGVVANVQAQTDAVSAPASTVASMPVVSEAPATPAAATPAAPVATATQAVPADPCSECDSVGGFGRFGGFGGVGLRGGFGVRGFGDSLAERYRSARAADHPIVEASPYANPNGSLQDWNRFRYYPYAYYPHNFSEKPNMSVPKYHPGYQNYYPVPRRYHEGSHFHLDVF